MATTKNTLISDIELRLTRGNISDDFEIPRAQIGYWLDTVRDTIVSERLRRRIQAKEPIPKIYIEKEECKLIINASKDCRDAERYYVNLTFEALSLQKDKAIVLVTNQAHKEIHALTHEVSAWIRYLQFSKPTKDNPTYYREGNSIYLQGMSSSIRANTKIYAYYVKALIGAGIGDDAPYLIEPELIAPLVDGVEAIALKELSLERHEDLANDGTQAEAKMAYAARSPNNQPNYTTE
jgi:hypothetical protein